MAIRPDKEPAPFTEHGPVGTKTPATRITRVFVRIVLLLRRMFHGRASIELVGISTMRGFDHHHQRRNPLKKLHESFVDLSQERSGILGQGFGRQRKNNRGNQSRKE
jgi:hypothetical protein